MTVRRHVSACGQFSPGKSEIGDIAPQPSYLQKPDADNSNDNEIQNSLYAGSHGYVAVNHVQADTDDDQHYDNIYQRHLLLLDLMMSNLLSNVADVEMSK